MRTKRKTNFGLIHMRQMEFLCLLPNYDHLPLLRLTLKSGWETLIVSEKAIISSNRVIYSNFSCKIIFCDEAGGSFFKYIQCSHMRQRCVV